MKEDKLTRALEILEHAKEIFQGAYEELMEVIDEEIFETREMLVAESRESVQDRFSASLNKQKLVSQLRDQLHGAIDVVDPGHENVNSSDEEGEASSSLVEQLRSQLEESDPAEASSVSLVEQLRSQLGDQEGQMELGMYDNWEFEEEDEEDEEEYYEEEDEDENEENLSPLASAFLQQMYEAELDDLPDPYVDPSEIHAPSPDAPNLSDVLNRTRIQMDTEPEEEPSEAPEVPEVNHSSLTMEEMIQQLRNSVNSTPDTVDQEKEEELITAAASSASNDITASLRQQLLVQELKKQLK